MKKLNVLLSLSLLIIVLVVSSCNDDEPQSKTDLLTSKSWAFTSVALRLSSGAEVDATAEWVEDCEKDNRLTFQKTDHTKAIPEPMIATVKTRWNPVRGHGVKTKPF